MNTHQAEQSAASERRIRKRFPCAVRVVCHADDEQVAAAGYGGLVRDVSDGGLRLLVRRPFSPGTRLAIDLPNDWESGAQQFTTEVVHVAEQDDGFWRLGCTIPEGDDGCALPRNFLRNTGTAASRSGEGLSPKAGLDDRFILFLRSDQTTHPTPERPIASYPTQEEAHQAQRELLRCGCDCVVRYAGPAGGGD